MNSTEVRNNAEAAARRRGFTFNGKHWQSAPGKFEGERWYAPYYWDAAMEGDGETIDGPHEDSPTADIFTVSAAESEVFGIPCGACVLVREDSQGFVLVTVHESRDAAEKRFNDWVGG